MKKTQATPLPSSTTLTFQGKQIIPANQAIAVWTYKILFDASGQLDWGPERNTQKQQYGLLFQSGAKPFSVTNPTPELLNPVLTDYRNHCAITELPAAPQRYAARRIVNDNDQYFYDFQPDCLTYALTFWFIATAVEIVGTAEIICTKNPDNELRPISLAPFNVILPATGE